MSNNPTEHELYTFRALAEQAQNSQVDVQQIMHHLQSNMEAMNAMQQQIGSLQASVHEQAQTQSQDQAQGHPAPLTSLTAAIEVLAAQSREQQQFQQTYQASIQLILERLAHRQTPRSSAPQPLNPKFKGNEEGMTFTEFRSKLITSFARFPDALSSGPDKVNYALQSMEGTPALFFAPYVNDEIPDDENYLTSWESFSAVMNEMHGDQHQLDEINHKLSRLRQTGPMSLYLTQFRTLSARSGWNEPALLSRFKEGLSDDIKNMLTSQWHTLTTLRQAQSAATTAYQNHQARARTQRTAHRTQVSFPNWPRKNPLPSSSSSATASTSSQSAASTGPMEVDHMRVKHITAEEKQRRREKNLCLYCGGGNHFAGDCPVKKARLAAVTVDSENESA
jgi:hypothetical protein